MTKDKYSLWVGGGEINDYPLNLEDVKTLEEEYINKGYLDVVTEVLR